MAGQRSEPSIISGINVTPLVDVVLVLLIIFMVTAKIMVSPAVTMNLPRASETEELQVVFSVVIPLGGPTHVNGVAAAGEGTVTRLARQAVAQNPEVRAVIHADGDVAHKRVIRILDLLKQSGMVRIAFRALSPAELAQ